MLTLMRTLAFMLVALATSASALETLDDQALDAVQGRSGIALDMQMGLNATPVPGSVLPATAGANFTYGGPLASLSGCTGAGNPCYLAMSFANRPNEWLVFKDSYFDAMLNNLHIDGGALQNDTTGTGYVDPTVFAVLSSAGGTQCVFTASCTTSNTDKTATTNAINAQHGLMISFHCSTPPTASEACLGSGFSYTPSGTGATKTGTSAGYTDLMISLSIGRMAVEFTDIPTNPIKAPTSAANDVNGSFIGLAIHDNNSNFAGVHIGGRAYVYGF